MTTEFIFRIFTSLHRSLRGSGLGKIRLFRDARDVLYRAFRPHTPRIVEVGGAKLWVDPSTAGGIVPWLLLDGVHEPAETRTIREQVPPGGSFVDVGANIGYYTVLAAIVAGPGGRVYGFEPEPVNFRTLKKNIELNGLKNVVAEPLACSDRDADIPLYLDPANAGGHHLNDIHDGAGATIVRTVTLSGYFRKHEGRIDLIKMDIQGHEPAALRGMRELLGNHRETKLITEFDASMIEGAGGSPAGYLGELRAMGFRFTILSDYGNVVGDATDADILGRCVRGGFVNLFCER